MSERQDSQVELQPMKTVTFDEENSAQDPGKDPKHQRANGLGEGLSTQLNPASFSTLI
jgi:hypothetical protein